MTTLRSTRTQPYGADVIAYTDGSCNGKTRRGGWGAHIILEKGRVVELWDGADDTTNNRMEIMGALQTLLYLAPRDRILIYSDSQYVINGITKWVAGWMNRGWVTGDGNPVKNADLWIDLYDATQRHRHIRWEWVKGHAGIVGNERADRLASQGYKGIPMP